MMEHKQFIARDLKLTEEGAITLAFTQLGVIDKGGDVGMAGSIPTKDVPMSAYGHTSWDGALPVGRGTIREADGWGVFDGKFLMDTTAGRDTFHTVKALADLQEWSYGYIAETHTGQMDGVDVRFLDKQDIFEVAPVLRGMGMGTHVMAIKGVTPDDSVPYADHLAWITGQWKAFMDRTAARADLRTKEGRTLSAETLARLAAVRDQSHGGVCTAIDDLMAASAAAAKASPAEVMEILSALARSNGITL